MHRSRRTILKIAGVLSLGYSETSAGKLRVRRVANWVVGNILLLRSRQLSLDGLRRVLVIAPHPDDGALGCGGSMALLTRANTELHVLYVTDGGASHPGHPLVDSKSLGSIRRAEALSAAAVMGVDPRRIVFLNAPDGRLSELADDPAGDLQERIAEQLLAIGPDAVFLPLRRDASTEHMAAFRIFSDALARTRIVPRVFEFPVWSWWNSNLLIPSLFTSGKAWRVSLRGIRDVKARAIASYASQLQPLPPDQSPALPEGFAAMFLGDNEFFIEH